VKRPEHQGTLITYMYKLTPSATFLRLHARVLVPPTLRQRAQALILLR